MRVCAPCAGPQQKEDWPVLHVPVAFHVCFLSTQKTLMTWNLSKKRSVQNDLQTTSVGQSLVPFEKGLKSVLGFVGFANLSDPTRSRSPTGGIPKEDLSRVL